MKYSHLRHLKTLRKTLTSNAVNTFGGSGVIKAIDKKIARASADRLVNARAKGIRFIRMNGRIIPVRQKVAK